MTTEITIYPSPERNLSPYQQTRATAPDMINDDFIGGFKDVLAAINPLQQLPGISTLYRQLTGDAAPSAGARIAGSVLFGGPVGLVAALVNSIVETQTGKDIGDNLLALVRGETTAELADASSAANDYIPTRHRGAYDSYVRAQSLLG